MEHKDFTIGLEFVCGVSRWRCTDVGTRVIVAIKISHNGELIPQEWLSGPPYALQEIVFDDYDISGCSLT